MEYNNDCAIRLSKLERRQKGNRGAPRPFVPGRALQLAMHNLDGSSMSRCEYRVIFTNSRIYPPCFNVYLRF